MTAPTITVVMPTFRRPTAAAQTLNHVCSLSPLIVAAVVIDNDPDASDTEWSVPGVATTVIRPGQNLGPAGAIHLGVLAPPSRAADWVLLADDNDPPQRDDAVERMLALVEADEDPDSLGGVGMVGARYNRRTGQVIRLPDAQLHGRVRVDYFGGGQLPLYRAAALAQVGGSRPELFFGWDDLMLGLDLTAAGWRLVADGDAHRALRADKPAVTASRSSWREYYAARNLIVAARVHGGPMATTCTVARAAVGAIPGRAGLGWTDSRRRVRGVIDALARRDGRRMEPT